MATSVDGRYDARKTSGMKSKNPDVRALAERRDSNLNRDKA
jgi:hypothetical protein